MPNSYFNHANPFARFTTVRAEAANSTFRAIESAFDKIPSVAELNQGSRNYSVSSFSGNIYSVTVPFPVTSYLPGLCVTFLAGVSNPTSAALDVNKVSPATIRRFDGSNLLPSDIRAMSINTVVYDGSNFRLVSMHGGTEALATSSANASASSAASAATSASEALASRNTAVSSATNAQTSATNAANAALSIRSGFRNLLINPFFWVSQRAGNLLSGTNPAFTFVRDRWKAGSSGATWSIASQTMTVSAGSVMQIVDGRNVHFSGLYTLSWNGTAVGRVNGSIVANGASVTLPGYNNIVVEFSGGTFQYPQLEFAPVKTAPEYRPTDVELSLCQVYFQKSYSLNVALGTSTTTGMRESVALSTLAMTDGRIDFRPNMRATPVITLLNPMQTNVAGSLHVVNTNGFQAYAILDATEKSCIIHNSGTSFTVGHRYWWHWVADAEI